MEKITSLAKKLQHSASGIPYLANFTLREGEVFSWNHTACAITYNPDDPEAVAHLLHEYGHAALNHSTYHRDIDLLRMEREAWDTAVALAATYHIALDEEIIEDALDSYRDWIHDRSLCPTCQATGIQTAPLSYRCIACSTAWTVNEARTCALRRYQTKKRP
jgi:hypothetical protein